MLDSSLKTSCYVASRARVGLWHSCIIGALKNLPSSMPTCLTFHAIVLRWQSGRRWTSWGGIWSASFRLIMTHIPNFNVKRWLDDVQVNWFVEVERREMVFACTICTAAALLSSQTCKRTSMASRYRETALESRIVISTRMFSAAVLASASLGGPSSSLSEPFFVNAIFCW